MRDKYEIFRKEELEFIANKRPELVPMDEPSLSDANILIKPSLDQIIIRFLRQYEVNVKPSSVGEWNGWDTAAMLGIILSQKGNMSNIAPAIFAANRSNQVNNAAQDWGTWKRWALDNPNFNQYKDKIINEIEVYNQNSRQKVKEIIALAELNNKKIKEALREPSAKKYIAALIEKNKIRESRENKNDLVRFLLFFIPGMVFLYVFFQFGMDEPEIDNRNGIEKSYNYKDS